MKYVCNEGNAIIEILELTAGNNKHEDDIKIPETCYKKNTEYFAFRLSFAKKNHSKHDKHVGYVVHIKKIIKIFFSFHFGIH